MGVNIHNFSSILFPKRPNLLFKPSLSPKTAWGRRVSYWLTRAALLSIVQASGGLNSAGARIQTRKWSCCKTRGHFCKDMTTSKSVIVKMSVMTQYEDSHRNLHGCISTFDWVKIWTLLLWFMDLSSHRLKRTVKRVYCHVCKYNFFGLIWLRWLR